MDKKVLVDTDVQGGAKLVEALDRRGVPVPAALWLYVSELEEWRLIIATPLVDERGLIEAYTTVQSALRSTPEALTITLDTISLVSPRDKTVQLLAKIASTDDGIHGIRVTRQAVSNILIEDAYVYRLNPPRIPERRARSSPTRA